MKLAVDEQQPGFLECQGNVTRSSPLPNLTKTIPPHSAFVLPSAACSQLYDYETKSAILENTDVDATFSFSANTQNKSIAFS